MSRITIEEINRSKPDHKLPIDVRPEWTLVSLGRDFSTTACIISGRILVTRTIGFATTGDAGRYCEFIENVMNEGLDLGQTYVHVIEWSSFKGGSAGARRRVWEFHQSLSSLQAIFICGATALMRMSIKLTQRGAPVSHDIAFIPDLDMGIHSAGKHLGLPLPVYFELPSVIVDQNTNGPILSDQIALLCDPPLSKGLASYQSHLSSGHRIEFRRIGSGKLFCRLTGQTKIKTIPVADILKARNQAMSKCLPGQSGHIEIWDCTNFHSLFKRSAIIDLFKALFRDTLPLTGCFLLDIGCRIRSLARWCLLLRRPAYPVHCPASLTVAILQAQELLQTVGRQSPSPPPNIVSKPQWHYGNETISIENEIVDQDIIHTFGAGYLQSQHIEQAFAIQRQLALEIVNSGRSHYIIGGTDAISGGSYKARKRFLFSIRKFYRDFPFRIYVFYGAKGKMRAAINLARHSVPFRMMLVDDFDSALAIIRADKVRRTYLDAPEPDHDAMPLPPAASQSLQRSVDGILHHLSTLSWEPDSNPPPKAPVGPNHPFIQIYDAIDLINEDLKAIYRERLKAIEDKQKLQEQLARSRKVEALGLLAGGVAHDLNNILSGIVSYPDALLMDLPEDSPMRKALVSIRDSGKKSAAIIQDLLIMARRGVRVVEPLVINELVEEYLNSPEYDAVAKRYPEITIRTALADDLNTISGSPMHIQQTIMNLVINAIEASQNGSTVVIHTANKTLDSPIKGYDTIDAGNYAILQVEDHGMGISKEDQKHIFEPFYTNKKMGRSGTGLGMAVVGGTIMDSNGFIDLQSDVGHGTLFTLYFPVAVDMMPADGQKNHKIYRLVEEKPFKS